MNTTHVTILIIALVATAAPIAAQPPSPDETTALDGPGFGSGSQTTPENIDPIEALRQRLDAPSAPDGVRSLLTLAERLESETRTIARSRADLVKACHDARGRAQDLLGRQPDGTSLDPREILDLFIAVESLSADAMDQNRALWDVDGRVAARKAIVRAIHQHSNATGWDSLHRWCRTRLERIAAGDYP